MNLVPNKDDPLLELRFPKDVIISFDIFKKHEIFLFLAESRKYKFPKDRNKLEPFTSAFPDSVAEIFLVEAVQIQKMLKKINGHFQAISIHSSLANSSLCIK